MGNPYMIYNTGGNKTKAVVDSFHCNLSSVYLIYTRHSMIQLWLNSSISYKRTSENMTLLKSS